MAGLDFSARASGGDTKAPYGVEGVVAAGVGAQDFSSRAGPTAKDKARKDAIKRVGSTPAQVRMITQGATLGFSDEMDAAGAALETGANNFWRKMTGQPSVGYGMRDAYDAVQEVESAADRKFMDDHPGQAVGLQIAGGLATPGMARAGSWIARGGNAASRISRGARVGLMTGAAAGAGTVQGGVVERGKGALKGAAVGAVAGGGVSAAGEGFRVGMRTANNLTGQRFSSPANSAAARLREALQADGVGEAEIERAVQEYAQAGATAPTLADVAGENTRALLRTAGSRPGAARNRMQVYREETVHGLPDAAIERSRALTPHDHRPAHVVAEGLEEARDTAARTDYAPAYETPVQIDAETASALRGDHGRAAIQRARTAAAARRDDRQMQELDALLASNMVEFPQVSAGTLDRIRIAMRERAGTSAQRGARDTASGLRGRVDDIDGALDNVEGLGPARENYRSHSQAIEAVQDLGPTLLRASPDEFAASVGQLDQRGLEAARVGARQALTDALGQRANAMGTVDQIAWAPNTRRNLVALFGQEEAERFIQAARLNLQHARNANHMAPNTGSQTQLRDADASRVKSIVNAVRHPLQALLDRVANGLTITDAEAEALVNAGLMDPQTAFQHIQPRMTLPPRLQGPASRLQALPGAVQTPAARMVNPEDGAVTATVVGHPEYGIGVSTAPPPASRR